jgi:hypothetical protein
MASDRRDDTPTFELWRTVINLGGLVIVGGMIIVIVATIISG